ncbi:MAG: hypothetical protein ABR947_13885 [Solirubrobacteraceae bacterium]
MANDASAALGAPQVAGTLVNPRGYMKKTVARAAGREVAGLVGSVAVSATEVAVVKTKLGWRMTPTDVALATAPRSELASAELEEGRMVSHLRLRFADGRLWEFDVPKSDKTTAREVVAVLAGSASP